MSSAGQGSMSFSQRSETAAPPVTPSLQQVMTVGNITTIVGLFNGGLLTTIPGAGLKWGVTQSDFVSTFASGLRSTMQMVQGGGDWGIAYVRPTSDSNGANLTFYKTRGGGIASVVGALNDADVMGNINWQGVSQNTTIQNSAQITARAVTVNGAGLWGAGAVPVGSVASFFDFINTNTAGSLRNHLRIFPNGEFCFVDLAVGAVVPLVDGLLIQAYGSAAIQNNLQVGAVANNNALAVLQLTSTTKGFLGVRMTAAQASALAVGASEEGLELYVTTTNGTFPTKGKYFWDGVAWVPMF